MNYSSSGFRRSLISYLENNVSEKLSVTFFRAELEMMGRWISCIFLWNVGIYLWVHIRNQNIVDIRNTLITKSRINSTVYEVNSPQQSDPTGGPRAMVAPTPQITLIMYVKLYINLLPVTKSSFIFLVLKDLKEILIIFSFVALRTSVTRSIDFKILHKIRVF